jgi:hypothetical protein
VRRRSRSMPIKFVKEKPPLPRQAAATRALSTSQGALPGAGGSFLPLYSVGGPPDSTKASKGRRRHHQPEPLPSRNLLALGKKLYLPRFVLIQSMAETVHRSSRVLRSGEFHWSRRRDALRAAYHRQIFLSPSIFRLTVHIRSKLPLHFR